MRKSLSNNRKQYIFASNYKASFNHYPIMKTYNIFRYALLAIAIVLCGSLNAAGLANYQLDKDKQPKPEKMVANAKNEIVGYYIGETKDQYHISVQDEGWIPKKGHHVVTISAKDGKGVITAAFSVVNVRATPSTNGKIIGKITNPPGELPETYSCLGYSDGWYKIQYNNQVGWVRYDVAKWWALNTF